MFAERVAVGESRRGLKIVNVRIKRVMLSRRRFITKLFCSVQCINTLKALRTPIYFHPVCLYRRLKKCFREILPTSYEAIAAPSPDHQPRQNPTPMTNDFRGS